MLLKGNIKSLYITNRLHKYCLIKIKRRFQSLQTIS